jgi:hypothetical protein
VLPPGQPLPQRNRTEMLSIKGNRGSWPSRSRTRATRKPPNRGRFKGVLWAKSPAKKAQGPHVRHPTRIPQEITLKTSPRKSQERAPKINKLKGKLERQHEALRNHAESSIHTMKVHTRSSLPPGHPSVSLDLTLSSQGSLRKTR